jgi:hypothetical protein
VSKTFGEWYQKTNKTKDTNKLTLLAFKIIAILHNARLATFIKLLETVSKGLFRNRSQNSRQTLLDCRRTAKKKFGCQKPFDIRIFLAHPVCQMRIIQEPKKGSIMKKTAF